MTAKPISAREHVMDYIKIRFGDDLDPLRIDFERTFDHIFRSMHPLFVLSECTWKPQMDIYETPDEIFVVAEIAGVEKENLEVEINSRALRLSGNRCEMPRQEHGTYRLAEIQYGRFERVLYFPCPIDTDRVSTSFVNGLLKIRLAKKAEKTCRIPIINGA
jgi:HSP20 family protein